ncbi:hypothetical protein PIB30_114717, partial [Stylosanthes scabra]|nr:hypothetical protein [Stylosanthes scabra]
KIRISVRTQDLIGSCMWTLCIAWKVCSPFTDQSSDQLDMRMTGQRMRGLVFAPIHAYCDPGRDAQFLLGYETTWMTGRKPLKRGVDCAAKRGTRAGLALHLLGVLLVLVIRRGRI